MNALKNYCTQTISATAICLLAGILGALPYYYEFLFILTFVSQIILFFVVILQRRSRKRVFLPFFSYFIGFYSPLYFFLSEMYPYERFGFNETQAIFIVICSCVLIPLLHAVVEALIMMLSKLFPNSDFDILGYSALWVIGEWVLSLGLLAFPWSSTAVSLTGFLPYIQTASLFGKYFITFITALICVSVAKCLIDKKPLLAYIAIGAFVLNTAGGLALRCIPAVNNENETVSVAMLQGNVLSNEKWVSANEGTIFDRYIEMAEEAAKNGAEIIVIPESAIPLAFYENSRTHIALANIAKEYNVTFVAGIHYYENGVNGNSVIAVYPDGTLSERYDKRHLVPFGEFIPFVDFIGKYLPFVAEFNEGTSTLIEGEKPVVIETEHGSVTPLVCFDSIFPQFARQGCKNGAEMIAVVTNDSWFNDSVGIYTHLRHAQIRAIENRKPILRAANTGVSAIINEKGSVIDASQPLEKAIVYSEITANSTKTLYNRIGDIVLYASFAIIVLLSAITIISKYKEKTDGNNSAS
ncbi:MAG: apolipoprotein N-acyltransferase [Clostridia bacterium]|nr:apolipoprotein N-acyltransferase [Clostridia bacterium]